MGPWRFDPPTWSRTSIRAFLCFGPSHPRHCVYPYGILLSIKSEKSLVWKTTREELVGNCFFSGCFCLFIVSNLKLSGKDLFSESHNFSCPFHKGASIVIEICPKKVVIELEYSAIYCIWQKEKSLWNVDFKGFCLLNYLTSI